VIRRGRLRGPGHVKLIIATIVQTMGDPVSFGGVISAWHTGMEGSKPFPNPAMNAEQWDQANYEERTNASPGSFSGVAKE